MNLQVEPEHYFKYIYDTKERFISYWHQIHEIIKLNPRKVLEIGIGNGFVCKYLNQRGVDTTTLDINEKLSPDIVGSVLNIPCRDTSFDVVACYELLEHLPFEMFSNALTEIFRVSKSFVILSLPDVSRVYRFGFHIPKVGMLNVLIPLPKFRKPVHRFDGEHYWEIGKAGYSFSRIARQMMKIGFTIETNYRAFEVPYHRFIVLSKTS